MPFLRCLRRSTCCIAAATLLALVAGCQPPQAATLPAPTEVAHKNNNAAAAEQSRLGLAALAGKATIVDLTHTFDETTIYWPTEAGFQLDRGKAGVTDKGYYYAANRFTSAEHGGTHLDAPIHFYEGRKTVDAVPLARLIGEAVVVDVRAKCNDNPDYQIGVGDLRAWEEKHERQLRDVIVILRTGWSSRWPDRKKYLGTEERGEQAVAKLHFPGLDPLAATWLVEHRSIKAVAIDTASIDYGQSSLFGSHVKLFEHNTPAIENIANLDELPEQGFLLIALPMKIGGGSGGPTRVVALLPAVEQ